MEYTSRRGGGSKKSNNDPSKIQREYEQLDILPLFRRLKDNQKSPFDSFSFVFDGISRSRRPAQASEESSKSKEWKVDDNILIEITGLYDETDNVIVERVQTWNEAYQQQQKMGGNEEYDPVEDISRMLEKKLMWSSSEKNTCNNEKQSGEQEAPCTVIVVHRRDMGPGKARTILQPLGLLRPESVLCLFSKGFDSPCLERNTNDTMHKKLNHPRVGKNLFRTEQIVMPPIYNGEMNPDADDKDHDNLASSFHPVVVTDDVFLRQRIVSHGGFVMTFHQLWILLAESQAMKDLQAEETEKIAGGE
ncbi:MAG: hypothetical protein SGILL_004883 [Bacillariaceae sp.]